MSVSMITHEVIKPITVGLCCAIVDNQITYEGKMEAFPIAASIVFGISSGIAVVAGTYIGPQLNGIIPMADTSLYSGKTLETRIIEVFVGGTGSYVINRVIGSNASSSVMKRIGIFAVADVFGEYLADYLAGEPLSYLK